MRNKKKEEKGKERGKEREMNRRASVREESIAKGEGRKGYTFPPLSLACVCLPVSGKERERERERYCDSYECIRIQKKKRNLNICWSLTRVAICRTTYIL